jgi:hypothetical protein
MLRYFRVFGTDLSRELATVQATDAAEAVEMYNRTMRVPGMPAAQFAAPLQW